MKRSRAVLPHLLAVVPLVAVISVGSVAQTADSSHGPAPRLIGVFDSRTGAPLPDVQDRDVFSGTYAVTTTTGTVRLDYLTFRGAAAFIELRRLGYQLKQIVVNRADTTPITEVMEPVVTLPRVVTTARYRIDRDAGRWDGFDDDVQPTFFVDGFEWNTKMGAPTDLTPGRPAEGPYTPTNVKGVEVYMSERNRPLRFTGDPTCGAIVIWTK